MKRALLLIFAISLCSVTYAYSAPKVSYGNNQPTTCNPANGDFWIDTNGTAGNRLYICTGTNTYTINDGLASTKAPALGADDNYVTDSEKIKLSNLTGTNTGDQNAAGVSVADAGGYYTGTNVEAILQEIGLAGFGGGSVDLSAYLSKTNTTVFTPSGDYHPATKKYVDDSITAGGGYTDEQAQDAAGGMFLGNTETGITVTYNDTTGKVDFVVATQSDVNFTSTLNIKLAGIATGAEVNVNADWNSSSGDSQILNKPTETPISASIVTALFPGTGDCLGKNGEAVDCGGAVGDIDDLTDVVVTGTPTTGYVLKYNGTNWVPAADATAEGAGYVSTPPIYSDEPCTAGQYANSTSPLRLYSCLGNRWVYIDSSGLVEWDNLTPVTRTLTVTAPSNGTITCLDSDLSAAINCGTGGSTCTATTADGVSITGITATADSGYALSAWSGDLSGATTPTTLTMSTDRGIGATFGASGPTVSLYFNADSDTDQQPPSKGSGLIGVAANVTSVPGQVGNAVQGAGGWVGVNIPTSGNLSTSTGTLAFYVHRGTDTGNQIVSLDGVSYAQFSITYQTGNTYRFLYLGTVVGTVDFAANTTYFVEMSWDQPNATASYRINGGSWTSTAVSGTAPTSAGLVLITSDGTGFNGWFDQVLISPNYQADLYSVRTNTSF